MTEAYRGIKVNSPRNLSGYYLPDSQILVGTSLTTAPAIVLAPQGPGTSSYVGVPIYRPQGSPLVPFSYTGGNAGTYGLNPPSFSGPLFGFAAGTKA